MSILGKYALKKFLRPFFASFLVLCIVIFVSEVFEKLDRFLADGVNLSDVFGYLFSSLPSQALQILPVACLLGTLFVVGDLARNREYIAGLAGGVSPEKFLGGLVGAGLIISIFALVANETVIPPTTRYAGSVFRERIRHMGVWQQTMFGDLFVAGAEGRMWNIKLFNLTSGQMERVVVDHYENGKLGMQIDAEEAQRTKEGWIFKNGIERLFDRSGVQIEKQDPFEEKTFSFIENPDDLVTQEPRAEEMNFKTFRKHINRLDSLGVEVRKLRVELMMKLSFPFACFVVILLGVPLAMKGKGNRAIGIAAAGILTLVYMGFVQFGKALAQRMIPPLAGAWLANIIFLSYGIYLWIKLKKSA